MAEIINLRQARKQKTRAQNEQLAEANRLKFGQTKADKQLLKAETKRAQSALDAHKLDVE